MSSLSLFAAAVPGNPLDLHRYRYRPREWLVRPTGQIPQRRHWGIKTKEQAQNFPWQPQEQREHGSSDRLCRGNKIPITRINLSFETFLPPRNSLPFSKTKPTTTQQCQNQRWSCSTRVGAKSARKWAWGSIAAQENSAEASGSRGSSAHRPRMHSSSKQWGSRRSRTFGSTRAVEATTTGGQSSSSTPEAPF
jgi:hypothetical protein